MLSEKLHANSQPDCGFSDHFTHLMQIISLLKIQISCLFVLGFYAVATVFQLYNGGQLTPDHTVPGHA